MPNYCENILMIKGSAPEIQYLVDTELSFSMIMPVPSNEKDIVGWRTENWRTKWDPELITEPYVEPCGELDTELFAKFRFDTAWSPPIGIYDRLVEKGYCITAYFFEPSCCFAGKYSNGEKILIDDIENIHELALTSDTAKELKQAFGLDEDDE